MENSTVSHFTRYNLTNSLSDLSEPYQEYLKDLDRAMFVNTITYSIITIIWSIRNAFVLFVYSQRKWNDHFSKTRNTNTENIMMARRDYTINAQEGYRKIGPEEEIENLDKGMNISKINVAINQRNKSTVSRNENRMQVLMFSRSQSKYSISSVTNFNMIFLIIICIYVLTYVPTITVMILDSLNFLMTMHCR